MDSIPWVRLFLQLSMWNQHCEYFEFCISVWVGGGQGRDKVGIGDEEDRHEA